MADGTHESLKDLCRRYDPIDLTSVIGSFYSFSHDPVGCPPPHAAIAYVVQNANLAATEFVGLNQVKQILDAMEDQREMFIPGTEELGRVASSSDVSAKESRSLDGTREISELRASSLIIRKPGSEGQMINYGIDRYLPHEGLIKSTHGFGVIPAFRAVRLIEKRIQVVLEEGLSLETEEMFNEMARLRNHEMLVPPLDFVESWRRATRISAQDLVTELNSSAIRKILTFLSVSLDNETDTEGLLSSWCILRRPEGAFIVPMPDAITETLVRAIHEGLLRKLDEPSRGTYGNIAGHDFEVLVQKKLNQYLPETIVSRDVKIQARPDLPDIDVLIEWPDSSLVMVQCRSGLQSSKGRWGNESRFLGDLERLVIDAANSTRRILDGNLEMKSRTESVIVVLDAYLPMVSAHLQTDSLIGRAFKGLPNPIVLSYYDLEELLWTTSTGGLKEYLKWRVDALKSGVPVPIDEMDLARIYFRKGQIGDLLLMLGKMADSKLLWIGDHREWQCKSEIDADARLGLL